MGRGFGITAAVDHEVAAIVAQEAERLGYTSFWSNDTQGHDGLETLAAAAARTTTIKLGVGVIGLDRRTGESIADDVERLDLLGGRFLIGVGSGGNSTIALVRDGINALHQRGIRPVVVGALGPNMSRLTGEIAEGVLFNWLTPEFASKAGRWVVDAANAAGRPGHSSWPTFGRHSSLKVTLRWIVRLRCTRTSPVTEHTSSAWESAREEPRSPVVTPRRSRPALPRMNRSWMRRSCARSPPMIVRKVSWNCCAPARRQRAKCSPRRRHRSLVIESRG